MAYCVRCGVKLESGSTVCPLCGTEVVASAEVIGEPSNPLFPQSTSEIAKHAYQRLDKNRKGVIELVIAFMAIAVITLVITAFALGASFSPWVPIASVILGGSYILVLFFVRPTYINIASWFVALTMLLLTVIDLSDQELSWSLYANSSVLLYWVMGVFPWVIAKHKRKRGHVASVVAVGVYLMVLDALGPGPLSWSLTIALPTYAVFLISLVILLIRIRWGKPTVTDIVLSLILSACWAVVAGDFFHLRSIESPSLLTWSSSVGIVAVCLFIFLTLNATFRRVRHYFNNRVV